MLINPIIRDLVTNPIPSGRRNIFRSFYQALGKPQNFIRIHVVDGRAIDLKLCRVISKHENQSEMQTYLEKEYKYVSASHICSSVRVSFHPGIDSFPSATTHNFSALFARNSSATSDDV